MKKGDRMRVIGVPPNLPDDPEMQTRALFAKCVGHIFTIEDIEAVEGLPHPLLRLDVGEIVGKASYLHTIWIEPQYVEAAE